MVWSYLYDLSFSFFVVLTGGAVLASAASVVLPAIFSGGSTSANWNVIAIVGSYIALAVLSLGVYLSRKITMVQKLKRIPKSVVANKEGDVPSAVAELVAVEYDRACGIYYLSQPSVATSDGWGLPGTAHEGVHFRRAMLDSVSLIDIAARTLLPTFPIIRPHQTVESYVKPLEGILARKDPDFIRRYSELIQLARYEQREPSEMEYESCMRYCEQIRRTLAALDT